MLSSVQQEIDRVYPELIKMIYSLTEGKNYAQDLVHDGIQYFCEEPESRQLEILEDGKVKEYIYTICKTQYLSSCSKTHQNYREDQILHYTNTEEASLEDIEDQIEEEDNNDLSLIFEGIYHTCNRLERQLLCERVLENKTYEEISKKHNIPLHRTTMLIKNTIDKIKNYTNGD